MTQDRKKNVGAAKYSKITRKAAKIGKMSKKNVKNKNSAIKKIEPGNPKKIKQFTKAARNSLGHKKLIPLTSVINLVLNLLLIASTKRKELVDRSA